MMRPMKLAGSELMFGENCLEYLKTLKYKKAIILTSRTYLEKSGIVAKVKSYLDEANIEYTQFNKIEPDPTFSSVRAGADLMLSYKPDLIIALGGGSVMDAAKAMWVYYEHEELKTLEDILPPKPIPTLRKKAKMCCIPATSGTASEVSRSVVISDDKTHIKYGIGNMEMMPDIAICDPLVTASMPPHVTAETGMDAMTHALEALVSNRANYVSDVLCEKAIEDIFKYLPIAFKDGKDMKAREYMLNASMIAGMAFTNVSLGIVHSMAHTIGSFFGVAHGNADAIILPYVIKFNERNVDAKNKYNALAKDLGFNTMESLVLDLNERLNIAKCFKDIISDRDSYFSKLDAMAEMALKDGCTKTNPVIPTIEELKDLFTKVYEGV